MMEQDLINYILWYCREWMKPAEKKALLRSGFTEHGDASTRKMASINKATRKFYGYDDDDVNRLVAMGKEAMEFAIAKRIFYEHEEDIINNCPKCGKLARTPKAKQCRHCFFSWR